MFTKPKALGYNINMSKRTDAIYNSLDNLENIQSRLASLKNQNYGENDSYIDELSFSMGQELKNLRFWIESLYRYNGKSTSALKKSASARNGKKGGRPPKEITQGKKMLSFLENDRIPQLEHEIAMADDNNKIDSLNKELNQARIEVNNYRKFIKKWEEDIQVRENYSVNISEK